MDDLVAIVSIISSVSSIILAIFAIWFSRRVEERLKKNFLRLKNVMDSNHDRTREVLKNIDLEAENIKQTVNKSQDELHQTLEEIIEQCNISKK
ncbi:MAG: hypothetical protein LLF83_01800 [Methanobacterium sp.]|nr:hypothetical protein [Methanobacterium sp.]